MKHVSILGTVGVPASYGGFETLADNLVCYAEQNNLPVSLSVYCSGKNKGEDKYKGAELRYIAVGANGISSIFYDIISLFSAIRKKDDVILLLGVSGAIVLPLIRLFSRCFIVTNIDGIEWKRDKWGRVARKFLRISELIAVKYSHTVIADNEGIAEHIQQEYDVQCSVIAYGGDHAVLVEDEPYDVSLPEKYALALCRIEPENNVEMILEGFSQCPEQNLVFIGNWDASDFGRMIRAKYDVFLNITMLDPIYDTGVLKTIRSGAYIYVHGHSAGGTNPSLVEMMHFGLPIVVYDCSFNRYTTDDTAIYFESATHLIEVIESLDGTQMRNVGEQMKLLAKKRYTWSNIGRQYFDLLL